MGRFISFVVRRWVVALLVVISLMFGALGYAQQGAQIWDYGPPGWIFQLVAFFLFAGVVSYLLFEWDEKLKAIKLPVPPSAEQKLAKVRTDVQTAAYRQMFMAAGSCDWEGDDYGPDEAEKQYSVLESALATARKHFELNTPTLNGPSADSLATGVRYLNRVLPFIQGGHLEEAKKQADCFIEGR